MQKNKNAIPEEVIVFTDGASRGNPGPASLGFVVTDVDGAVVAERGQVLGEQTNNFAEYMALVEALKFCKKAKVKKVLVRADSQLMIRQMLGQYKVKSEGILPLFEEASRLAEAFQKIEFEHIPREKNKEADRLANSALDERRDL